LSYFVQESRSISLLYMQITYISITHPKHNLVQICTLLKSTTFVEFTHIMIVLYCVSSVCYVCVFLCVWVREKDLPVMKTDSVHFKAVVLDNTSNIIQCRYFICLRLLVTSFGIVRSNAAHREDYGFCYESSAVAVRNPLVQRVICVTRVGTLNKVTVRNVFLNSEEFFLTWQFTKGYDLQRTEHVSV
jgi:hypothetical protein